jgi:hypothetical protein
MLCGNADLVCLVSTLRLNLAPGIALPRPVPNHFPAIPLSEENLAH